MREADQAKKDAVSAKNDAENLCYSVEKQLSELKDKMTTEEAEDLKSKMSAVRESLVSSDDSENIQRLTKELQEASWEVTKKAYAQSSGGESAGGEGGSSGGDGEKKEEESKFKEEKKDAKQ
jgi:molecular chaperone DnaK